jgi:putative intracellular protease/amidase
MPSPRLIDPSVFYDVVKIRKAVDEAAQDSVRASNGVANNATNGGRMDLFGAPGGGGAGAQLSKERVFKIRQKAVRLLAKAFELDEVATSVATMAATSTLEDVGGHVLRREGGNIGAYNDCSWSRIGRLVDKWCAIFLQMRSTCTSFLRRSRLAPWSSIRLWIL